MSNKQPVILMYHGIIGRVHYEPRWREEGAELYDVGYQQFTDQMQYLKDNGYKVVTLDSMKGEDKEVIITFDDGEMNNFDEGFVILRKFGYLAYFFVVGDRLGTRGYLGEVQMLAITLTGMKIGSHGLTHKILTEMSDEELRNELVESKRRIDALLEKPIDTISVPRGFSNNKVIEEAHKAGYKDVFISDRTSRITLPCYDRVAVKSSWTIERFAQALKGEKPSSEKFQDNVKSMIKAVIGDSGYNNLRKFLLKFEK